MRTAQRLLKYIKTVRPDDLVEWFIHNDLTEEGACEVSKDLLECILEEGSKELHLRVVFLIIGGLQTIQEDQLDKMYEELDDGATIN